MVINVKANDTDVEGNALTTVLVTNPANGTVALNAGNYIYTPKANFTGTDTFTYRVWRRGRQQRSDRRSPSPSPPSTTPRSRATTPPSPREDTPVTVNVLANDSDVDGDA